MHGLNNGAQSAGITTAVRELCAARAMSRLDFPQYPPSDDQVFSAAGVPTVSLGFLPKAEAEVLKVFMADPAAAMKAKMPLPAILGLIHTANDKIGNVQPATRRRGRSLHRPRHEAGRGTALRPVTLRD